MPDDAELVRAAQCGDAASLGALLERHRAEMHAVAISVLGWNPDADDAVQDAMLTALRRLGELRDPAAAGAWLKAHHPQRGTHATAVSEPGDAAGSSRRRTALG